MQISSYLRKDNPFDYIILGFLLKLMGNIAQNFVSHQISDAFFGTLCWFLIFQGIARIPGKLSLPFKGIYKILVNLFLFLCLIMIIRGYLIDYNYMWISVVGAINYHLFYPTYLICYLVPFFACIPIRYFNFRLITLYSSIYIIITALFAYIFKDEIIANSMYAAMGFEPDDDTVKAGSVVFCGQFVFLTLLYRYIPRKFWCINVVGLLLCFLLMIIGGRRGGTLLFAIIILGSFYFFISAKKGVVKFFTRILSIAIIVVGASYIVSSSMSSFIIERGLEDNRSWVEETMLEQMTTAEKIFGKGLNGRYYAPMGKEADRLHNGYRYGIETGFYNIVLKGGYFMALIYCLILLIPMYKGWFKSKNDFCKAGAFFILYHLISLKPFGIITFDLSFFLLWIMISCCMDKRVRNMNENEIKYTFFYNL